MWMQHILTIAAATGASITASATACPPTATVNATTYSGLVRNGVDVFLGIRYGQDTGGENRFRPPRLYTPSPGAVEATDGGPTCPQSVKGMGAFPAHISEDCLKLNIVRPRGSKPGSDHAVMVWIHGGSFWGGSKDVPIYEPDGAVLESVKSGNPIIHVGINYRYNIFGFAQHPDLLAEGSTNAGLRDQRLAFEWVRDNIASFGGDPTRVTIYGQSSGGLSVGLQLLAHGGAAPVPFQRAIMESQALEEGITGNYTRDAMQRVIDKASCSSAASAVQCLRDLSLDALMDATDVTYGDGLANNFGDIWLPQVDGDFLPAAPEDLVRAGRFARGVPAMIGWCEDDLTILTPPPPKTSTPADTRRNIADYLPGQAASVIDGLLALYPSDEFYGVEFYRSARILRDLLMVCPPVFYGRHLASSGASPGVFLYNWNQTTLSIPGVGVAHTSELNYVFANLTHPNLAGGAPKPPTAADFALMHRATRSWAAFANGGDPGKGRGAMTKFKAAFGGNKEQLFIAGGPDEGMVGLDEYEQLGRRCEYIGKYVNTD